MRVEPLPQSAVVIPFPAPQKPQPPALSPHERLTRALATLNAALAEQRTAIASWRAALTDLKAATTGLGESLQRYRTNLGSLGDGVAALRTQANTLENWANQVAPSQE